MDAKSKALTPAEPIKPPEPAHFLARLQAMATRLGFSTIGIAAADIGEAAARLKQWMAAGRHGEMDYMPRHVDLRSVPNKLYPGVRSVICAALDYWPDVETTEVLHNPRLGYVSRYALGRDYHKLVRMRLQKLALQVSSVLAPCHFRVFCDSAPVMEVELARRAGIGWRGKHTLLLSRQGSYRFLGEIYTTLPWPEPTRTLADGDAPQHCGICRACLDACPTGAIVAPYELDARLCISYLTIELKGSIPEALRPLIGNRIYGCDDCQLCCPWNRFAQGGDPDFMPRYNLAAPRLVEFFAWSQSDFEERLAGSAIRRIGHERWLRNIAVALGNGPADTAALHALASRLSDASPMLREHITWAMSRLQAA